MTSERKTRTTRPTLNPGPDFSESASATGCCLSGQFAREKKRISSTLKESKRATRLSPGENSAGSDSLRRFPVGLRRRDFPNAFLSPITCCDLCGARDWTQLSVCCRLTSLARDGLPISDGYFYQSRDNDSSSKSRVGENGGGGGRREMAAL